MAYRTVPHLNLTQLEEEIYILTHTELRGYPKGHPRARQREGLTGYAFDFFLNDLLQQHRNAIVLDECIKERKTKTTIKKAVLRRRIVKRTTPRFLILPVDVEGHFFSYVLDKDNNIVYRVDCGDPSQSGISDRAIKRALGGGWSDVQLMPKSTRNGWYCGDCGPFVLYYINKIIRGERLDRLTQKKTQEFRIGMGNYLEGTVNRWI